jgi:wyosine [tRNA(Phe)-imidazoG37] synthetase (radical SAM superfamily)
MEVNSPRFSRQNIYGPVQSRRLGNSLGINLMPTHMKVCSFDCVYCECGFNDNRVAQMPKQDEIRLELKKALEELKEDNVALDVITFSGNGEPTLHPDFESIIDFTLALRNQYFPQAKVAVLSNATVIDKNDIFRALKKVDNNILKLDSAIEATMRIIDQPTRESFTVKWLLKQLERFEGNVIIQTLFTRGKYNEKVFDNTTDEEISAWLLALARIKPKQVMIYTLDRPAPIDSIERISLEELNAIAEKVKKAGFEVVVAG